MSRPHPPKPVIAIVVLTLLGLLAWWLWPGDDAAVADTYSGVVENTDYTVASTGAGVVKKVVVALGDTVRKGQVVVQLDAEAAKAQIAQARAGVAAARAGIEAADTTADRAVARARLAQAKAGVRLAQIQRDNAVLRAPHDGVVTAMLTGVGQVAAPGRALLTIVDPTAAYVRYYISEPALGSQGVGRNVQVQVADKSYDGRISYLATTPEFTPNNIDTKEQRSTLVYEVRVEINGDASNLKAGQSVDVIPR